MRTAQFFATSMLGADEFDPVNTEGLVFTSSVAYTLSYAAYSTALTPSFGMGVILRAIFGAFFSSFLCGNAKWEGFQNAPHPMHYLAGGMLMRFGGVLAGGCSVGWLLTSASVINSVAFVAFVGFIAGLLSLSSFSKSGSLLKATTH